MQKLIQIEIYERSASLKVDPLLVGIHQQVLSHTRCALALHRPSPECALQESILDGRQHPVCCYLGHCLLYHLPRRYPLTTNNTSVKTLRNAVNLDEYHAEFNANLFSYEKRK